MREAGVDPECHHRCDLYRAVALFLLSLSPVCPPSVRAAWRHPGLIAKHFRCHVLLLVEQGALRGGLGGVCGW